MAVMENLAVNIESSSITVKIESNIICLVVS